MQVAKNQNVKFVVACINPYYEAKICGVKGIRGTFADL